MGQINHSAFLPGLGVGNARHGAGLVVDGEVSYYDRGPFKATPLKGRNDL